MLNLFRFWYGIHVFRFISSSLVPAKNAYLGLSAARTEGAWQTESKVNNSLINCRLLCWHENTKKILLFSIPWSATSSGYKQILMEISPSGMLFRECMESTAGFQASLVTTWRKTQSPSQEVLLGFSLYFGNCKGDFTRTRQQCSSFCHCSGSETKLGNLIYVPARDGPTVWEIGFPDRTAIDFYVPDVNPKYVNKLFINSPEK